MNRELVSSQFPLSMNAAKGSLSANECSYRAEVEEKNRHTNTAPEHSIPSAWGPVVGQHSNCGGYFKERVLFENRPAHYFCNYKENNQ